MFITPAYAQSASGGDALTSAVVPILLMIAVMYFLIIRPQRNQMKKKQEVLSNIRRGDIVITAGGVVGKVVKVFDETGEVEVEIAEATRVRVLRGTIADVRTKGDGAVESKPVVERKTPAKATRKRSTAAKQTKKDDVVADEAPKE